MMGLFNSATSGMKASSHRPRGGSIEDKIPEDTEPDDTSILSVFPLSSMLRYSTHNTDHDDAHEHRDENEGSIIMSLIGQLRCALPCTYFRSCYPC